MIQSYQFEGTEAGPHVLLFGAIHGNEPAGAVALQNFINQIETDQIKLLKGRITCVPICNPKAFEQKKRYIDLNLNRIFNAHSVPQYYEQHLANHLTNLVDQCDYLIDLHSVTAPSPAFCFLDHVTPDNLRLVNIVQAPHVVTGWSSLYEDTTDVSTQDYAHQKNKSAITIECGQHDDPQSITEAYRFILNALDGLGLIENHISDQVNDNSSMIYNLEKVIYKSPGLDLKQNFKNFQIVAKDEVLAASSTEDVIAPFDGAIIMPNPNVKIGEDLFYLATVKSA